MGLISSEGFLMTAFSLCPHVVFPLGLNTAGVSLVGLKQRVGQIIPQQR